MLETLDARRTGRPTSCSARGDTLGVFQLDGGADAGAAAARWRRTASRTSPPCCALYRPGPMGANAHNDYADRKNGRKPVVPIHPELAEPLAEILDDTYGLIVYQEQVMAIAQQRRRLLPRRRRPAAPGDGQEEEGDPRQGVRPVLRRHAANGLLRRRDQDAVGHPRPVLRLRVQQGAHRRLRAGLVLDRLPQGQLPGRVHGRAADQRRRRQGQVRALPRRVPADGHQGAAARRQRVRRRLHPGRHRHPLRALRGPQRRRQRRRVDRRRRARRRALHRLLRLPAQGRARSSATSGPSSR